MNKQLLAALTASILLIAGCATSINKKNVETHYNAGKRFELNGDPQSAKDQYAKALVNAKLANGEPALISMLTYNYGRMLGHTCQYEESERTLREALEIEKGVTGPNSGITSMRLFELARLNHDNGKFDKSVTYFEDGIPIVENLGIEQTDPIGYSNILEIYKNTLVKLSRVNESNLVQTKIDNLLVANPGKSPGFTPLSYKCN